jgi:hypothetical protein
MTIDAILSSVQSAIIANFADFTEDNCSIADEAIFDYVQTNIPAVTSCCLVDYAGFTNVGKSEFSSSMINYKVVINAFFLMLDQDDYTDALEAAREFVDTMIGVGASDSTLGGTVLRFKVDSGTPPLSYRRSVYNYILVALTANVIDNVS